MSSCISGFYVRVIRMNKREVIAFFDKCAPGWDAHMVRDEEKISFILDVAGVKPGISVLDVACGTGVLFQDYLARGVSRVTGVDISPEMARIAVTKLRDPRVVMWKRSLFPAGTIVAWYTMLFLILKTLPALWHA